jgi:ribA/ribD-fused uncharacterized protein
MDSAPALAITRFRGEHDFLSNFYASPFFYRGDCYPTAEHAYQAAKTTDPDSAYLIRNAPTPGDAKRRGRAAPQRPDWMEVRRAVMYEVVREKFRQDPELRDKLRATGDATLIEGNTWGDRFWGMVQDAEGNWSGENRLGEVLMRVRREFR